MGKEIWILKERSAISNYSNEMTSTVDVLGFHLVCSHLLHPHTTETV